VDMECLAVNLLPFISRYIQVVVLINESHMDENGQKWSKTPKLFSTFTFEIRKR
jgi:hypothetical protein